MSQKPCEFWIDGFRFGPDENAGQHVYVTLYQRPGVHVIEVSAVLNLEKKYEKLMNEQHDEIMRLRQELRLVNTKL